MKSLLILPVLVLTSCVNQARIRCYKSVNAFHDTYGEPIRRGFNYVEYKDDEDRIRRVYGECYIKRL